tara:strand:- start:572 stop:1330 length:759 start_codon:yes stop_codon:yes gene_type:complete
MKKAVQKCPIAATLVWFFYAVTTVLLSILISWALYSQANYGYGFWYQQLDIGAHIQEYGPQNRFRTGFEQLPAAQHRLAFEQIRDAVHSHGEGLATITYTPPGRAAVPLLHDAEVRHLQDVADLIDAGRWLMLALALLCLPLALLCIRLGIPSMASRIGITVFGLGAVIAWLAIAGPTQVFYQFHLWLFPAENQWFFYWEDSLMSTLMKAPVLFGGIAVVIALGALLLVPVLYWLGLRLSKKIVKQESGHGH